LVQPFIAESVASMRAAVARARAGGLSVGLVPTMGALHAGHQALIRRARADNGFVVVSIFVNPAQFGPHEDLAHYPRPFAQDVQLCAGEGVDAIFHPAPETVYPPGFNTFVE